MQSSFSACEHNDSRAVIWLDADKSPFVVSDGKQWRETDFYWHEAVRMETAPLFISNFSP